jgi:hypothetical protein
MPRYDRLCVDIDAEPWSLTDVPRELSGSTAPAPSSAPFALRVDGASAGALMLARRGAQSDATTDLVVSPALAEVLRGFRLPRHAGLPCAAVREPFDLRRMRMRKRTEPAELEWTEADVYALDLVPLGLDVFLSRALADALRRANLPGLRVLPPRTSATVIA